MAQSGRALRLGRRCRVFKSLHPDQFADGGVIWIILSLDSSLHLQLHTQCSLVLFVVLDGLQDGTNGHKEIGKIEARVAQW